MEKYVIYQGERYLVLENINGMLTITNGSYENLGANILNVPITDVEFVN